MLLVDPGVDYPQVPTYGQAGTLGAHMYGDGHDNSAKPVVPLVLHVKQRIHVRYETIRCDAPLEL